MDDYGAFMEKFTLKPSSSSQDLPLSNLSFAVKDIFDVDGHVTGFGNPDWSSTHSAAKSTAPAVSILLDNGATCIGKTIMDEMAYSINGENEHYGTPVNPCATDRVPGGSSSGSAVVVSAMLVDFSLGTDTGGSVRVPASYCSILGFRPSHGVVSTTGVIPMAQSFDTVGWFARDPSILNRVGRVILQLPQVDPTTPSNIIIAEDCFKLLSIPSNRVINVLTKSIDKIFGGKIVNYATIGDYIETNVPSLKEFIVKSEVEKKEYSVESLSALSTSMRLLQRYEFKNNHGEWISSVKPKLGPGIRERVCEAVKSTDEKVDACRSVKSELRSALTALIGENGILVIPSIPGPPPKLKTEPSTLETFRARAFSLLSIAGVSGFCQVLFEEARGARKIILNRPKKLNSLNHDMICQMLEKLKQYENDPSTNLVILKANGKAFCAGGDVTSLMGMLTFGHWSFGASFFRKQLTLDHLIATYSKPLVSLVNGIVMGGGNGLSMHGRFRIVTEKTVFAMPEASIGLFPDVGASHFLSRLPGFLGEYLGLTGARLDGMSMLACGLATHFVLSKDLTTLENALDMASGSSDFGILTVLKIINKFTEKMDLKQASIISRLDTINECFSGTTVEEILSSLIGASANREEKWITDAISSMKMASPTSLKVSLRSIKEGRAQNLDQCFIREFKMFCQFARREITDDFFEGSRAMLIDKDKNPRWVPSKIDQVNDEMVNKFFLDFNDEEWEPLKLPKRSNISSYNLVSRI